MTCTENHITHRNVHSDPTHVRQSTTRCLSGWQMKPSTRCLSGVEGSEPFEKAENGIEYMNSHTHKVA
jgi:hypothetical protein